MPNSLETAHRSPSFIEEPDNQAIQWLKTKSTIKETYVAFFSMFDSAAARCGDGIGDGGTKAVLRFQRLFRRHKDRSACLHSIHHCHAILKVKIKRRTASCPQAP